MRHTLRSRALPDLRTVIAGGLCLFVSIGLAGSQGGYFPTAWGWSAVLALAFLGFAGLFATTTDAGTLDAALVAALATLTVWIGLSAKWSVDRAGSVLETERALVYLAVVATFLLVVRRSSLWVAVASLQVGITVVCAYALATRLFPQHVGSYDAFAGYRLEGPIGYWNGLAIFAVLGTVLAIGAFLDGEQSLALRVWAATSLVVLAPTMYFTFSRGGWIALAVGIVAWFLAAPRRFESAALAFAIALAPTLAVALAGRTDALTHTFQGTARAESGGVRFALWLVPLILAQAILASALALALRRVPALRSAARVAGVTIVVAALVAAAGGLIRQGGPVDAVHDAYDSFLTKPPPARRDLNRDLNRRLFTLSSNGRADLWHVAWRVRDAHPALGAGAGTFERFWLRDPRAHFKARDAHNLYLETLAELGPIGLALLASVLLVPFLALNRSRDALSAGAFGAFAAYLAHATIDWDWELSGLTASALLCAAMVVVAGRAEDRERSIPVWTRTLAVAAGAVLFVGASIGWIGNATLASAVNARDDGRYADAIVAADRAHRWMPWSARPRLIAGEASLLAGARPQARRLLREALAKDDGDWETWLALSRATAGRTSQSALARAARLNRTEPTIAALEQQTRAKQGATK